MKGSCLCGTVQYEIDQLDGPIGHCHCRTCRKSNAAAFTSTAWVNRDRFRWLKGRERLSSFESSPGKQRRFCSVCGSHLVAEREGEPQLILRVATLDDDPGCATRSYTFGLRTMSRGCAMVATFPPIPNGRLATRANLALIAPRISRSARGGLT